MNRDKFEVIAGGLLHDVGKVVHRQGDGRQHSISGYEFLKDEVGLDDEKILNSVRYHHCVQLKNAEIAKNDFSYITYIADNIAASADRRKIDNEDYGFEQTVPLESVFNILNGNNEKKHYKKGVLGESNTINFPTQEKVVFDEHFYLTIIQRIKENLKGIYFERDYLNSLVEVLEANLTYVPSSTAKDELGDISLFDHSKLTAAIGACILDYLKENRIVDYKQELFANSTDFYDKKAFILLSMDMSGIQNFIYTIHSEGALKNLRARSFYLEIMMEHINDTLLERLELSKANLIYSGGGHCYLLIPNTQKAKEIIANTECELNEWFIDQFGINLYVAFAYEECSANSLKNYPRGSYREIFKNISNKLSEKKSRRYSKEQIIKLNSIHCKDYTRECKICKKMDNLNEDGICNTCAAIKNLSKNILYSDYFAIYSGIDNGALNLPFNCYLLANDKSSMIEDISKSEELVRVYSKNVMNTGKKVSNRVFVGNYSTGETFTELAEASKGIKRMAVLRADVDNLGKAFVSGFEDSDNDDKYVSLSRTATLSRQLTIFFKYHINSILEKSIYTIEGDGNRKRNAAIVYSGGDDIFIVGSWSDVIELAVDIKEAFEEYTQGTLSISAGIGIYHPKFPISVSASETETLENESKRLIGKNAITILPDGCFHKETYDSESYWINDGTYNWDVFIDEVIGEKFETIYTFFENSPDRGNSFLYGLLELIRTRNDKINFARYVYLLTRMEPKDSEPAEIKKAYKEFSLKMYEWIKNEKDCIQLKTAITLYVYLKREQEEE